MENGMIVVKAEWDPEAEVYVAESDDVPGLVTEASDRPTLAKKLEVMIPELLEANGISLNPEQPCFKIVFRTIELVRMRA